ncbi:MAG: hypothetical protein AAFY71_22735 [Bacteroidota bacterium]
MKSPKLFALIFLSTMAFGSCSKASISEPEQIGPQVFKILKTISINGKKDYIDNFLSIEEIRELGKNEEVVKDESTRNEMTSMLKEKWIKQITRDYNQIKEEGAGSGIVWQDIEYLDFIYTIKKKQGVKGAEGELYFKYSEDVYKVETSALWNGKEYRITEIEDLSKK